MADRSIKLIVGANVTGLVNGMRTAKGAVEDFTNKSASWHAANRQNLEQLGSTYLKVGTAVTAAAGFAVKSAMDWETAWTGVLKTVDGTPAQLAKLEDGLRSLAKETGFAHAEVAAVGEAAGQLGISTGGIEDFTRTMLDMGVSTNVSAEEAATGLARFRNIMGSSESEITNMGSTIVGLGNNFATTEREILEMSMRVAGAGRQAGLTESDVMALAASMSSVGIEAEAGGTAMSLTMKRIGKEVDSGGKKLELFSRIAGMPAKEFRKAWQSDAAGTLTKFVAGLDKASKSGESVNGVLAELGITGIREADALLRLSGNAEGLSDALGLASESWAENNALTEEAGKFYGTSSQQIKQAWASIKDSAIDAGATLAPMVADMAESVASLAETFQSLPAPVKSALGELAGVTGVTLLAAGGAIKLAGALSDVMGAADGVGRKSVLIRTGALAAGVGLMSLSSEVGKFNREAGIATSTLGGMAAGFAVGGPWGSAIGGAIGLVKGFGDAHKDAAREVETLVALYDQATGKMTEAARSAAIEDLNKPLKEGAFGTSFGAVDMTGLEAAKTIGIDLQTITDAAMGSEAAIQKVTARLDELRAMGEAGTLDKEVERLGVETNDLADAYGYLGEYVDKNSEKWQTAGKRARDAAAATAGGIKTTREFADALDGVPAGVETELKLMGYRPSALQIDDLIRRYKLTPEQVQTVLAALDRATPLAQKVQSEVRRTDGMTATPTVNLRDNASGRLAGIGSQLSNLAGRAIDTYINVIERKIKKNADGGFHENGVKRFADGGFDEFGRPVARTPQIRSGSQGTVMWGEAETGWEAYVSGKPSQRPRNRAILSEAAGRLGGSVQWFADGGFTEAVSARELTEMRIRVRDLNRALNETEVVGKGKNKRKRLVLRRGSLDRRRTQQELREAKAELAEQQSIRKRIGKGRSFKSIGDYNKQEELRETASSFASDFDSDAFRSPASLERALANKLRESAEFTQTLAALRKKGASKWLIDQLIEFGPSRSTNRTAKALLSDTDRLKRLNAMSSQLGSVASTYASVVAGGGLSAAQSRALSSAVAAGGQVNLSAASVQEVASAILAGSRNVSVRTVDDREYLNAGASRYPSPLAGVRP